MASSSSRDAARRAAYHIAAALLIAVWFYLTVWPGWHSVGFLSDEFSRVSAIVNVSLLVGVLANLFYSRFDAPWLRPAGGLVTDGLGLAVLVVLWRVYPFAVQSGSAWNGVIRTILVISMVGTCIDVLVQSAALVRSLAPGRGRRKDVLP